MADVAGFGEMQGLCKLQEDLERFGIHCCEPGVIAIYAIFNINYIILRNLYFGLRGGRVEPCVAVRPQINSEKRCNASPTHGCGRLQYNSMT